MKFKLPIFSDPRQTLNRWASEIRRFDLAESPDFVMKDWVPDTIRTAFSGGLLTDVKTDFFLYSRVGDRVDFAVSFSGVSPDALPVGVAFTLPYPAKNFFDVASSAGFPPRKFSGGCWFDGGPRAAIWELKSGENEINIYAVPIHLFAGPNVNFSVAAQGFYIAEPLKR